MCRRTFRVQGEPEKGQCAYCSVTWAISYTKMCVCVCVCVCVYMFLHLSMMRLGGRLSSDGLDFHPLVTGSH